MWDKHCDVNVKKVNIHKMFVSLQGVICLLNKKQKQGATQKQKWRTVFFFFNPSVKYLQQSEIKQCSQNLFNTFSPGI